MYEKREQKKQKREREKSGDCATVVTQTEATTLQQFIKKKKKIIIKNRFARALMLRNISLYSFIYHLHPIFFFSVWRLCSAVAIINLTILFSHVVFHFNFSFLSWLSTAGSGSSYKPPHLPFTFPEYYSLIYQFTYVARGFFVLSSGQIKKITPRGGPCKKKQDKARAKQTYKKNFASTFNSDLKPPLRDCRYRCNVKKKAMPPDQGSS